MIYRQCAYWLYCVFAARQWEFVVAHAAEKSVTPRPRLQPRGFNRVHGNYTLKLFLLCVITIKLNIFSKKKRVTFEFLKTVAILGRLNIDI